MRAGGLIAVGAGLAACAKATTPPNPRSLPGITAGRRQNVNLVSATGEILVRPGGDRFPFALFVPNTTNDRYAGGTARIWIARDETSDALGPFDATWRDRGLGDRGIYSTRAPFSADGAWLVLVEARAASKVVGGSTQAASGTLLGGTTVGVGRRSEQPVAGDRAISVASPTFENHRGVNPICTRKPPCSMHDLSLDVALRNGKPTVLIIGTPQFCESRICGPMVDVLDAVKRELPKGSVNFVHVEQYPDDTDAPAKHVLAPAAKAWKLESEPATYFIRPDGMIAERFVGAADQAEVADQVKALS